nr:HIT family protein [Candidatus Woesearchaeota archaeon]
IKKEIKADIVYEDKISLGFLDINPVNLGHILLIPKDHHKMMVDTPDDLISKLFMTSKKLMKIIEKATKADFVILSVVGIDVPHFHIHLIPRHFNDGLANFWPTKKYKNKEVETIAKKIKSLL